MPPDVTDQEELHERIMATLAPYPIQFALLFGSQSRGDTHGQSDIDIAVIFEDLEPGDQGYTDELLDLGAALSVEFDSNDVDVIDLRTASPTIVQAALKDGEILVGDEELAEEIERSHRNKRPESAEVPSERFDDILARIDDHFA